MEQELLAWVHLATAQAVAIRMGVALAVLLPLGRMLGVAFPTGMRLVEGISREPTPWFWGINGATGVLASVLGVMLSMAFGINITLLFAALFYLALIPAGLMLMRLSLASEAARPAAGTSSDGLLSC